MKEPIKERGGCPDTAGEACTADNGSRQTFHFVAYRTIRQTCVYTRHEQHAGNPDQNTVNQECHVFGFYNIDAGCDRGLLIAANGIEGMSPIVSGSGGYTK